MKRNAMLKILNPILGLLLICQIATGMFRGAIPYEVFEDVHGTGALLLGLAVVLHVILNWNWVVASFFKSRP